MPKPQLKVRSISASAIPPVAASQEKTGCGAKRAKVEGNREIVGDDARQIVGIAAAGDVGERAGRPRVRAQNLKQRPDVEPRRGEQRLASESVGRERRRRVPASPERSTTRRTSE